MKKLSLYFHSLDLILPHIFSPISASKSLKLSVGKRKAVLALSTVELLKNQNQTGSGPKKHKILEA